MNEEEIKKKRKKNDQKHIYHTTGVSFVDASFFFPLHAQVV